MGGDGHPWVSKPQTSERLRFRRTIWSRCRHTRPGLELETWASLGERFAEEGQVEKGAWCFKAAAESPDSLSKRLPGRDHSTRLWKVQ